MSFSPVEIEVLLHCYYSEEPYPRPSSAVRGALSCLAALGLIASNGGEYRTTPRGQAHVKQLQNLELPVQVWVGADGKPIEV